MLLRASGKRRRNRCATDQRHELPSPHPVSAPVRRARNNGIEDVVNFPDQLGATF